MKFSENWLREFVNPDLSTQALVDQLTMAGLEVDGFDPVAAAFNKVVVGEILETSPHPDADKLVVCRVSSGTEEHQVVCGAPNARAGIKVPFALVGAKFPDLKIKKAKLRGVESHGMLCSERELGLSEDHQGLMELPLEAPVGDNIIDYLNLDDSIIDLDLTPNRSDCLSMIGLARETGLINQLDVNEVDLQKVEPSIEDTFPVELSAGAACSRFVGRIVRNIDQSAQSPLWMKEKLRRSGLRSIDPVVDVTNYVMLELGQPLHAYDHAKLKDKIVVRQATAGEKVTLLDGSEVETLADTLLITDGSGPIGLAGVMGGLSTSVTHETKDIFLEGAFFAPTAIAGRARSYAHRFERGVDWQGQKRAIERATELLIQISGGQAGPVTETVDSSNLPTEKTIELRASRVSRVLGVDIDNRVVDDIFARLNFPASTTDDNGELVWIVSAPSHRFDIAIEADLIEEISRVYGYNNLPTRTPVASLSMSKKAETELSLNRVRDHLVGRGYFEAITYSFVDTTMQAALDPEQTPIALANPLSAEMSVMRTSIWPGLVKSLIYNVNRQQARVRLFESGLCFSQPANQAGLAFDNISQIKKLAGVVCGPRQDENWSNDPQLVDFFDVKGDIESVLALTGQAESFQFVAQSHPALHAGQSAAIQKDGATVGYVGLLDPRIQQQLDIRFPIFLFELTADSVIAKKLVHSEPMSRFPEVRRDIAVIVDQGVTAAELRQCITTGATDTLQNLKLFDVYQGKGIDPNRKSLAIGLTFQHASRTLTDDEINDSVDKIVASLEAQFGASLRN
ncbi:MAG TPA: phenylalanine--tRNA ligase subunit beta [Gammaproteobacteria bacterium]|nr:phenylalanine--tRNA ligase subunit beta [Gammaproteobacteria bacterium]